MKFELGNVYRTAGIENVLQEDKNYIEELINCFTKYISNDFGDICEEDIKENFKAIKEGNRILGAYDTSHDKVYLIKLYNNAVCK